MKQIQKAKKTPYQIVVFNSDADGVIHTMPLAARKIKDSHGYKAIFQETGAERHLIR